MSLATALKEEKGTVKKLQWDIQQLEKELAEAEAVRKAAEKVGFEGGRMKFCDLSPSTPSFLFLLPSPLCHHLGTVRAEKEAIIDEETV